MEVKALVKEIKTNLKQTSSSRKDEINVMQAMLNDKDYEVGVYGKDGEVDTYNPSSDFRGMCSSIVSATTKISKSESENLLEKYEVTKNDSSSMVNISKEFLNTYLDTGRKVSLGGRNNFSYSLSQKEVPSSTKTYPKRVGINEDGTPRYENGKKVVPAHKSIKAYGSCPSWVK